MAIDNADRQPADRRAIRLAVTLFGLAIASVAVATIAGVLLLLLEPDSGSTAEATLGITAAIAGLATAGFTIAALIYTQAKNLWRFMPRWLRIAFWIVIGVGVAITVWNLIGEAT